MVRSEGVGDMKVVFVLADVGLEVGPAAVRTVVAQQKMEPTGSLQGEEDSQLVFAVGHVAGMRSFDLGMSAADNSQQDGVGIVQPQEVDNLARDH